MRRVRETLAAYIDYLPDWAVFLCMQLAQLINLRGREKERKEKKKRREERRRKRRRRRRRRRRREEKKKKKR